MKNKSFFLVAWLLCGVWLYFSGMPRLAEAPEVPPAQLPELSGEEVGEGKGDTGLATHAVPDAGTTMVHAPSLVALPGGGLLSFWYGGTREGAADVNIYSSRFENGVWGQPQAVLTRKELQEKQYRLIRKLGNPVAVQHPNGRLYLFFVSVSVGGWAGSSVNMVTSTDAGSSWSRPKRLVTSPFLNVSTLVKGVPLVAKSGTILLPVYHEFLGKFSELLMLDPDGRILGKHRMTHGRDTLQPVLFANGQDLVALMRYAGDRQPALAQRAVSVDGGQNWFATGDSEVPNPNSALTGGVYGEGNGSMELVVANNNFFERDELSLLVKRGEGDWSVARVLEDRSEFRGKGRDREEYLKDLSSDDWVNRLPAKDEVLAKVNKNMCRNKLLCFYQYDYPYMVVDAGGHFHVAYTWNKSVIKHLEFDRAWIEQGLESRVVEEAR